MKISDIRDDELVRMYIGIRDRRDTRKDAYDKEDAEDKARQKRLEAEMLKRFQDAGVESVRTQFGTAYKAVRTSCSVADKDVYSSWFLDAPEDRLCFIELRANKTAVEQYKAVNHDLPPGLSWKEEVTVNFKRS